MAGQVGLITVELMLGPVWEELGKAIKKLGKTSTQFRGFAEGIKLTCELRILQIQELQDRNTELKLSNENLNSFRKKIEEGLVLARKCSKVRKWDLYKRYRYTTRLQKLDALINTWSEIMMFEQVRDGKEQLKLLKKTKESWVKLIKDRVKSIFSTVEAWVRRLLSVLSII